MSRAKVVLAIVALLAWSGMAVAGVNYADPAGGWTYSYDGAAVGMGAGGVGSLDGTWRHDNGSDKWVSQWTQDLDGNYCGVESRTEGSTTYANIKTTGRRLNSKDNAKIYNAHMLSQDGVTSNTLLDDGVTLSFRARLDESTAGQIVGSTGKGMFTITQGLGSTMGYDTNTQIGFSLVRGSADAGGAPDQGDYFDLEWAGYTGNPYDYMVSGLAMNNNGISDPGQGIDTGNQPMTDVDQYDPAGWDTNIAPISGSLYDWHEFWITIQADGIANNNATHEVTVYMDGSLVGSTFYVTAGGNGGDEAFDYGSTAYGSAVSYLSLGDPQSDSSAPADFDVDFFSYKPGIIAPIPEPMSALLLALGSLVLIRRKR